MDDETRWLDPDERHAWVALVRTVLRLPTSLDAQLQRDAGVTFFEYLVIAMLSEQPDRTLQMSDLAELAAGSLSRLSHVVTRLERRELVRRRRVAGPGRRTTVTLTDDGMALIEGAAPGHVDHVRAVVLAGVTPEDLAVVARVSAQIDDRIAEQATGTGG